MRDERTGSGQGGRDVVNAEIRSVGDIDQIVNHCQAVRTTGGVLESDLHRGRVSANV